MGTLEIAFCLKSLSDKSVLTSLNRVGTWARRSSRIYQGANACNYLQLQWVQSR